MTSNHLFWVGVLVGILVTYFLPWWITGLLFAAAIVGSGVLAYLSGHHAPAGTGTWLVIGAIGTLVGLYFGRLRALRQLGEHEFRTRRGFIRGISRFF